MTSALLRPFLFFHSYLSLLVGCSVITLCEFFEFLIDCVLGLTLRSTSAKKKKKVKKKEEEEKGKVEKEDVVAAGTMATTAVTIILGDENV